MPKQDIVTDSTVLVATLLYIVADIQDEHPQSAEIVMAAALELEGLRKAGSLAEARSQFAVPPVNRVVDFPRAANGN